MVWAEWPFRGWPGMFYTLILSKCELWMAWLCLCHFVWGRQGLRGLFTGRSWVSFLGPRLRWSGIMVRGSFFWRPLLGCWSSLGHCGSRDGGHWWWWGSMCGYRCSFALAVGDFMSLAFWQIIFLWYQSPGRCHSLYLTPEQYY